MKASKLGRLAGVRVTVLAASLILTGVGVVRREYLEVLQKAVRICLECIGIG